MAVASSFLLHLYCWCYFSQVPPCLLPYTPVGLLTRLLAVAVSFLAFFRVGDAFNKDGVYVALCSLFCFLIVILAQRVCVCISVCVCVSVCECASVSVCVSVCVCASAFV